MAAFEPKIDGLYLDGVAYDRTTMRRVRAVWSARAPGGRREIDFHREHAGEPDAEGVAGAGDHAAHAVHGLLMARRGVLLDRDPDYWLAEVSGIPYGLMGETLGGPPELSSCTGWRRAR